MVTSPSFFPNLEYKARFMRLGFTTGSFTPESKETKHTPSSLPPPKGKNCLLTSTLPKPDSLRASHVIHSRSGRLSADSNLLLLFHDFAVTFIATAEDNSGSSYFYVL